MLPQREIACRPRPQSLTPPPGDVARAESEVGAAARIRGRRDQPRDVGGIVGEVGVHLDDPLGAGGERAREAGDVGRAEPLLDRPVQDLDPLVGGGEAVGDLTGAVGR